ncbi:cysteine desulfurase family protein [Bdellovibrionota bacterium FG-2]
MKKYRFFDNASTTKCCEAAIELLRRFSEDDYANPSSSHAMGQLAAKAIREARVFFADTFRVDPTQVLFTGSGTESDNLAVQGVALSHRASHASRPRILCTSTEHPAVKKSVESLISLGFEPELIPVDAAGNVLRERLLELLNPAPLLVSIQRVNNITGTIHPVEELAALIKAKAPDTLIHTDAVQAFGKVSLPTAPSKVDFVSLSAHKIEGPKGAGALIVLNRELLRSAIRPLIWGGNHEGGFRAGTQNPGLIAGFHAAAKLAITHQKERMEKIARLNTKLREMLAAPQGTKVVINSPADAAPHILSFSVPGVASAGLARCLEDRDFIVSTGSACGSEHANEPDPVLSAMGLSHAVATSALRVSFSHLNEEQELVEFAQALRESIEHTTKLMGSNRR